MSRTADRAPTPSVLIGLLNRPSSGVVLLLVFYVGLVAVFSVLSPFFLSVRNMLAIGGKRRLHRSDGRDGHAADHRRRP